MTSVATGEDKPRILVVDDDPNQLRALVIGLNLEGFEAVGVTDGGSALEMLAQDNFRVALFDLMMPSPNGLQLARQIRSTHPRVITILMSAYQLSATQLNKADVGVVGFIPKPSRFEDIVAFIHDKLRNQEPVAG